MVTSKLRISTILRTNQLLLIGTQPQIDDAIRLIEDLDIEIGLDLKTYQFEFVSAKQIDELIRHSLVGLDDEAIKRVYQSTVNEQGNQIIATARAEIHGRIESLKKQLDVETAASERKSPIRFYTLKNVKAIDILDTLQSIERRVRDGSRPRNEAQIDNRLTGIDTRSGIEPGGLNRLNRQLEGPLPTPPFLTEEPLQSDPTIGDFPLGTLPFGDSVIGDVARLVSDFERAEKVIPGEAKITVDENTNTLIVVAEPAIQQLYAELIEKLDKRRPQVLIEVHVVIVSGQGQSRGRPKSRPKLGPAIFFS
jgi:type II secretory pathway component GspD/PulD (secretin)